MGGIGTSIDLEHPRLFAEVVRDLNTRLSADCVAVGHRFGNSSWATPAPEMPKSWRWLACYAVRGESEGFYVHIDIIYPAKPKDTEYSRMLIAMCKVWSWEEAFELSNAATRILHE